MTLKELINSISKKEWRFVILLCIVMILITGLPYVYAYLNAPAGYFYNGIHSLTPGDSLVYFSYINQVKAGNLVLRNYFTSENQAAGLLNFFWLIVGLFAKIFYLRANLAFHIFRLLVIPLFLGLIYIFTSYFFTEKNQRKISLIFLCFSSGIGAYFADLFDKLYPIDHVSIAIDYKWPIDLFVPDFNIFLTLYQSPHFILSLALMIAFFLLMLLAAENDNYKYSLGAGLVGFFWFNFHPFYFPYVFFIVFIYYLFLFFKTRKIKIIFYYLIALILSLPFVFYHYYKIKTDLVIGARASQNVLRSPGFLFVFLGFGFLFIFSVLAIIYLIKNKNLFKKNKYVFLFSWLVGGFLLIYSFIFYQIRFLQGLQIPMVFFTIIFFYNLLPHLKQKFAKTYKFLEANNFLLIIIFIILFGYSTVFNLARDLYYFKIGFVEFYLPNEFAQAVSWLKDNNVKNQVILSYEIDGNMIPSLANQRVYIAHWIETINYKEKRNKVFDFFADRYNESQVKDFLKTNNIGYVFFTDWEKKYGQLKPQAKDYLKLVFSQGQIDIYEVIN